MTEEHWRAITGYEDRYEVSDAGRVRKISTAYRARVTLLVTPVILTPKATGKGYLSIDLARQGRKKRRYIHVLVLEEFVGPAPAGMQGAHEDGVRGRNHLDNLSWKTIPQNHADKYRHGTMPVGERNSQAKLTEAAVLAIRSSTDKQTVLATKYGVSKSLVSQVRVRKIWKHI